MLFCWNRSFRRITSHLDRFIAYSFAIENGRNHCFMHHCLQRQTPDAVYIFASFAQSSSMIINCRNVVYTECKRKKNWFSALFANIYLESTEIERNVNLWLFVRCILSSCYRCFFFRFIFCSFSVCLCLFQPFVCSVPWMDCTRGQCFSTSITVTRK